MKLNMSKRKISKWLATAGLFLCLLLTAVPAYADEETTSATQTTAATTAETTTAAKDEKETSAEPETTKAPEPETKEPETELEKETGQAKTEDVLPTGNLTLVDDVISAADGHREFLTVVSKDGSYFYIVIDRDTQGAGNVYFMNLVDNQDLYKLTGEKATEVKETTVPSILPQQEKETDAEQETTLSEEEVAAQKQKSLMITVGFGAAIVIGVVIYVLKKKKSKKQSKAEFELSDFDDDDE